MPTIDELKELEITPTPLFLFDCVFKDGSVERWGTHAVAFEGHDYSARLLKHNLFELRASSDEGLDAPAKISVTLANADSHFSQLERESGFKGSQLTVRFLFFDLASGVAGSEARVMFRGIGNTAEEITESTLRVGFSNRLNLQRLVLPEVRIQRRCPWSFPATLNQRQEALDGGSKGKYSALYRCGYSVGLTGGAGNLDGSVPFNTCDYTRASCSQRGMFSLGRFGGIEFVPPQIQVRGYGEAGTHLSPVVDNLARFNDVVPIVYGTGWYDPPLVFSRNDGNLTVMEVLLGMGEMDEVVKVIVNDIEIPEGVAGADMTATGWYSVVTAGQRSGQFNPDFRDASGNPLGDPYGSMAVASVVVPNRIANGQSVPRIKVLAHGVKLERFDETGISLGESFSNNPAWVMLDVLRRSGWLLSEIDTKSFATSATYCDELIATTDLYGNSTSVPRFQCNAIIRNRRSAAEIARGIRAASSLQLIYGVGGLLTLRVENTLALQQPSKPVGSNSVEALTGGWPVYEFSDGSAAFSGILRKPNGEPTIRLYSRSAGDTANRLTVEFQDEFNEFQQDSLSLVDVDDALLTGREVSASFQALGLPNFDQATRLLELQLAKSIGGSTFIDFETTVRGVDILPGDIITLTYLKEGLDRQPLRVVRLAPGPNYETVAITAQWHSDDWYTSEGASAAGGRRRTGSEIGIPRPLVGTETDSNGLVQFGITETAVPTGDGGLSVQLVAAFTTPSKPSATGLHVPLVSLSPTIASSGGTLAGGVTWYYAVSTNDIDGESGLSFTVRAKIPAGPDTYTVALTGLSFSSTATTMNVYRGTNPEQLLRIAAAHAISGTFTDAGLTSDLQGPPDANYDHAAFYWRLELEPEANVEGHSSTSVSNSALGMPIDEFKGAVVSITRGTGARQERVVATNDATTLTVSPPWLVEPDSTSYFAISEATWVSAGVVQTSPVQFQVPGHLGETVQISGRSANVLNRESAYELNPLTRWQIGTSLTGIDSGTPPAPSFGLNLVGNGSVELLGLGFTDLTNTRDIEAGTLSLFYWDELGSPSAYALGSTIVDDTATLISVSPPVSTAVGTLLQIDGEILEVVEVHSGGSEYLVIRGSHDSTATSHLVSTPIYHLQRTIKVVPLVRGLFGSPASGSYSHSMYMPDVRIGAAELFMTNLFGDGLLSQAAFGATTDVGLRTLSGGQLSIQVEGYLAIETSVAPAIAMDAAHSVRDIFALVREAPDGGPIHLTIRQNGTEYYTLTIPDGTTISDPILSGFGLPPLVANARITLDITSVPGAPNTLPGRDLTVTIRL